MSEFYRHCVRPLLFTQDPESIHDVTLQVLGWVSRQPLLAEALADLFGAPQLPVEVFGLTFPNPVGLGAGMDKDGSALPAWAGLGFGFTELGAVTWHTQPGNPLPRVFRAVADEAIVNRMGFNNPGAEAFAAQLTRWREGGGWPRHPVGVNLGKSRVTPLDQAAEEYARTLERLWAQADFFVVNVSSPNTPDLRQLQDRSALEQILAAVQGVNRALAQRASVQPKPLLIKVAPDLSYGALDEILELVEPHAVAGLVATNTTVDRPDSSDPQARRVYAEAGGLSGRPLRQRSTEIVRHLFRQGQGRVPLIGVGGIFSAADAWEKVVAGASLVQVYTGLVYEGPGLPRRIVEGLHRRLLQHGFTTLSEAVGTQVQG